MANWYGSARTNYFRVKDEEAFRAALAGFDIEIYNDDEGRVTLLSQDEYGGWPSWIFAEDEDEEAEEAAAT